MLGIKGFKYKKYMIKQSLFNFLFMQTFAQLKN